MNGIEIVSKDENPDFFAEFSPTEDGRFHERERIEDSKESQEAQAKRAKKKRDHAKWGDAPSMRDQITKMPDTVRLVAPVTKVLNLSKPEDLAELNKLKALERADGGPTIVITEYERKFHEGVWWVFITHERIQYQQLI
jgi:hypothetical protein